MSTWGVLIRQLIYRFLSRHRRLKSETSGRYTKVAKSSCSSTPHSRHAAMWSLIVFALLLNQVLAGIFIPSKLISIRNSLLPSLHISVFPFSNMVYVCIPGVMHANKLQQYPGEHTSLKLLHKFDLYLPLKGAKVYLWAVSKASLWIMHELSGYQQPRFWWSSSKPAIVKRVFVISLNKSCTWKSFMSLERGEIEQIRNKYKSNGVYCSIGRAYFTQNLCYFFIEAKFKYRCRACFTYRIATAANQLI